MPELEEIQVDEKTKKVFKRKGYNIDKPLGAGSFGKVYLATKEGEKCFFAVKVMDLSRVSTKFKEKFLPRELAALIEVKHPNIIETFDIFRSNQRIYIFMEYISGGDIAGYIKKNGPLNEVKACKWFAQVCDALNYLHNTKYMAHRDIKVDNIMLNEEMTDAKLTDFGFVKESWDQNKQEVILSDTFCGTEPYYSPEILRKVKYDPYKADVWAMGITLFAMTNNKYPFHFAKVKQHLKEIDDPDHLKGRFIKKFSRHYKELLKKMLERNEPERIGIKDVCDHKWIKERGNCSH